MQNNLFQAAVALLLLVLMAALLDPFMLLMPAPVAMACLVAAAALVGVFAGFVLAERARDEREAAHRLLAGRAGYLAGLLILTLGFLYQGFVEHHVDAWLAAALAAMVVVKLAARFYADWRN